MLPVVGCRFFVILFEHITCGIMNLKKLKLRIIYLINNTWIIRSVIVLKMCVYEIFISNLLGLIQVYSILA